MAWALFKSEGQTKYLPAPPNTYRLWRMNVHERPKAFLGSRTQGVV